MLGRDVFGQGKYQEEGEEEESPMEVDLFSLIHCFYQILDKAPKGTIHEVHAERISVTDRIYEIMAQLKDIEVAAFSSLFEGQSTRERLIVTFLAILEMTRLKMLKITQAEEHGEIYIKPAFETAEVHDIAGKVTLQ
jgi:segregation and condensation protein A